MLCGSLFVLLFGLYCLRLTTSDYTFGIVKLFSLQITAFILNLKVKSFYGPSGEEIVVDYKEAGLTYEGNPIHLLKVYITQ